MAKKCSNRSQREVRRAEKKHENEKRDKKIDTRIDTREDYKTLADLSYKVVLEFGALQKDFNEEKNKYDEGQKAIDKKKGFKYYLKKFVGIADTPPTHSYHAWMEEAENVSDSIKPGLYNADALKHDIRLALQKQSTVGRSSGVKLTTSSTELLPDATPPMPKKQKQEVRKTGPE